MSHSSTLAPTVDHHSESYLKSHCYQCGSEVPAHRHGWSATCLQCDPEPTAADWRDYELAAEALDAAFLDDMAALDAILGEPDPSTMLDLDARYGPYLDPAEHVAVLGIGHPASEA